MTRPITLFTGQWADLPFEEMCRLASQWGYDGLEIACWGDHFEVDKALSDDSYVDRKLEMLAIVSRRVFAGRMRSERRKARSIELHPRKPEPAPFNEMSACKAFPARSSRKASPLNWCSNASVAGLSSSRANVRPPTRGNLIMVRIAGRIGGKGVSKASIKLGPIRRH